MRKLSMSAMINVLKKAVHMILFLIIDMKCADCVKEKSYAV